MSHRFYEKVFFLLTPQVKQACLMPHLKAFCCLACGYLNFSLSPSLEMVPDGREDEKEMNCQHPWERVHWKIPKLFCEVLECVLLRPRLRCPWWLSIQNATVGEARILPLPASLDFCRDAML